MARSADPVTYGASSATSTSQRYRVGVLRPDDSAVREIEDALQIAERSGDDLAVAHVRVALGVALAAPAHGAERHRGQKLMAEAGEMFLRRGHNVGEYRSSRCTWPVRGPRRGDRDNAIPLMRAAVDHLAGAEQLLGWGIPASGVLVETLLDRGAEDDVAEAEAAIDRLAALPPMTGW